MKDHDVALSTKIRIVKAIVFPVAMYGCEGWTLTKADWKRVDAFELWCWRRLLRVPWTAKRTNKWVLDIIKPECSLGGLILRLKLKYFGHVMRAENSLERMVLLGKVEGRRGPGRPKTRWFDGIKLSTGMTLSQLRVEVGNRSSWRRLVHEITQARKRVDEN